MNYNELVEKVLALELQLKEIEAAVRSTSAEVAGTTTRSELALNIATLNEYIHVLNSAIRLAKRVGLPDDFAKYATEIQRIIRIINQLKIAYYALSAAEMAAGDPLAYIRAGIAIGSAVVTAADTEW